MDDLAAGGAGGGWPDVFWNNFKPLLAKMWVKSKSCIQPKQAHDFEAGAIDQ